jgi:carbon-monoxide dehydrogenase medium subunit
VRAATFEHLRADDVEHALELLAELGGEAKLLAGGQSLIPMMNLRFARPSVLVDIGRLTELRSIDVEDRTRTVTIGSGATHHDIDRGDLGKDLRRLAPVFGSVAGQIGHLPIRTRGTFGGSIAHADPAAEWCLLTRLLDATMIVARTDGERAVSAGDFYSGPLSTDVAEDELLRAVRFSRIPDGCALVELARRAGDFAIVAAAAALDLVEGRLSQVRLALGGVAATPRRIHEAEDVLEGVEPVEGADGLLVPADVLEELDDVVRRSIDPPGDLHGSPDYRRHLAATLAHRAVERALAEVPSVPT